MKKFVRFYHHTLEMLQGMMEKITMTVEKRIAGQRLIYLILYHLMMRKKMRDGKLVRMQHQLMRFYSWERRFHLHLSSNKLFLGIL